jgi:hypothetical protein
MKSPKEKPGTDEQTGQISTKAKKISQRRQSATSGGAYQPLDVAQLDNLPEELRSGTCFVCWREALRGGKSTKIPVDPHTGADAESDNPATWGTMAEAVAFYQAQPNKLHGIGRMFSPDDGIIGIDFDDCLDDHGNVVPGSLAPEWLPRLDSYTEVSPSGLGCKVWLRARHELDGKTGRRDAKQGVEIYRARRYFTITGKRLPQYSATVASRQQEIEDFYGVVFATKKDGNAKPLKCEPEPITTTLTDAEITYRAGHAKNGLKFQALWTGNIDGYGSQSEADAALCSLLWFWTGGDRELVRRLFGQSVLGQRAKWTDRPDYQETTLDLACKGAVWKDGKAGPDADDEDAANEPKTKRPGRPSAATRLVTFADKFEFFHDPQIRAFVRLNINDHVEIWPVNSTRFRNLLAQLFYKRTRTAINRNALADAVSTLDGLACHGSPEEPVFLRIAPYGENILIDLCDPDWRVVEVAPTGWRVLEKSPIAFIRTGPMRPLPFPMPTRESTLAPLWGLLNVTPAQRPLVAGALLNYFHPHGPYFVTNFVGEQGSAKSCAARIQRTLVDPNEIPLRSPPREERDLLVHASNNWCVVFDNLSGLPPWLSDGLCRLSTGGGHSARQLYTDGEEFSLSVKRPIILNGIEDVAARPDLAERALQIELETIPDDKRKSEKELWQEFEAVRPGLFSVILNGLACALRELPTVKLDALPRMADAALWASAGETAFGWQHGTFIGAYRQNLNEGAIASLDAHPVGVAIRHLLEDQNEWAGEPAQLLSALDESVSDELRHSRNWPKTPRALSVCLRRLAQALRRAGIDADFKKGKRRHIRLCKRGNLASLTSPATADSPDTDGGDAKDANLQPLHDASSALDEKLVEELI